MFYLMNDGKKGNKKNSNPYRMLVKSLVNQIRSTDIDILIRINLEGKFDMCMEIEKFALWVKSQDDNISYKEVENRLRRIYKSSCVEHIFFTYISALNIALYEDAITKYNLEDLFSDEINLKDVDINIKRNSRTILATICLYLITLEEKLLDKKIEYVDVRENYEETTIVKHLKSENMSVLRSVQGIPVLLTKRETMSVQRLYLSIMEYKDNPNYSVDKAMHDIRYIHGFNALENLISKYCFGKEIANYIHIGELCESEMCTPKNKYRHFVPIELLHNRKVLPPTNGVILKLKDHKSIESIYIRECSRFDFRIIYGVVRYHDGNELPISLRMYQDYCPILSCTDSLDVCHVLIDFYEIPIEHISNTEDFNPVDYEVLSPYYWKWRHRGYETNSERESRISGNKVKKEHTIKISTYVRNIKGAASKEARELAKKIQIVLEKNQTLVREHNRVYNRIS